MSFDINLMSDEQLDEMLERPQKIPSWKIANTQSAREKKRIRQLELHNKQLQEQRLYQKKKQRERLLAAKQKQKIGKQSQTKYKRKSKEKDDGLEL